MLQKTIEDKIKEIGGHSSGFDYLRLVFAVFIIIFHTFTVCYGRWNESTLWLGPWRPACMLLVPVFFTLSGFLVAGSLQRTNHLPTFLALRFLRIFPALCGEVLISALIIGPFFTVLPLGNYFLHPAFRSYFLNILGSVHYRLPGIFLENPSAGYVNLQLWTIPFEFECYALITVFAFLRIVRKPLWFGITALLFSLYAYVDDVSTGMLILDQHPTGHLVTTAFLWGIFLYMLRDKLPYSFALFCICCILIWPGLYFLPTCYLAMLPVAYATIYLGLMNPRKIFLINKRDYSYALYLYSVPIQQSVYAYFPFCREWYSNLLASLFITGIFAFLSWTFLESPTLKLKKPAIASINALCARLQRTSAYTYNPA